MGRPVGICLFVLGMCSLIALALTNVADARVVTLAYAGSDSGGPDPLKALAEGGAAGRADRLAPVGEGLPAGVYRVADLANPAAGTGRHRTDQDIQLRSGTAPAAIGDITPGLYATAFATRSCSYQLQRVMADHHLAVIGEDHLSEGRLLVDINGIEPDWFSSTPACGRWYRWQPPTVALSQAGNGDYWVGDLARGVWRVPAGCRWEKTVGFRGADIDDVVEFGTGPTALVVDGDTYGVRLRGCNRPLTLDVTADGARLGPTTGITTATSAPPAPERSQARRRTGTAPTDPAADPGNTGNPTDPGQAATAPPATTGAAPQPAPTGPGTTAHTG